MLRTLVLALAIGAPGFAAAEQFPESALNVEVRADDGSVLGRVSAVERNAEGEIVAMEIPGLEPGDAPRASNELVAENRRNMTLRVSDQRATETVRAERRVLR